ncbi:YaaA family protein [Bacteroides fragilis]|nr:YaaA family protein [Bacteroides fragilis]
MSDVSKTKTPLTTFPGFRKEAAEVALQMSQFSVEELERLLKVNPKIAVENYRRYQAFHSEGTRELPALLAYTGIVFKRVHPRDFSEEDFCYAQGSSEIDLILLWVVASSRYDSALPA